VCDRSAHQEDGDNGKRTGSMHDVFRFCIVIGSPRPSAGEGLGVRGFRSVESTSRNRALDQDSAALAGTSNSVLAPSPLTPLPHWGEGNRGLLGIF
jgi:hypothetical protein